MTEKEFQKLIDRYLQDNVSESERSLIDDFLDAQNADKSVLQKIDPESEMWPAIQTHVNGHKKKLTEQGRGAYPFVKKSLVFVTVLLTVAAAIYGAFRHGLFETQAPAVKWLTLTCPRGQKSTLTLSDGSVIRLNSATTISYPEIFAADKREITLSGEAFFEIAKEPGRPFVVHAGGLTTRVLGTSFNVSAFPDEKVSVTVATGKVAIEPAASDGHGAAGAHIVLEPDHQVVYDPHERRMTTARVNIERFVAWKNSVLKFEDTSLGEAAVTLERWYNVTIRFDNDQIKNCRINGQYKNQSLRHVLESIQYMYRVDYKFLDQNNALLYGNGCH